MPLCGFARFVHHVRPSVAFAALTNNWNCHHSAVGRHMYSCNWAWCAACVIPVGGVATARTTLEQNSTERELAQVRRPRSLRWIERGTWPARILYSQFMCTAIEQGYPVCRSSGMFVVFNPFDSWNVFHILLLSYYYLRLVTMGAALLSTRCANTILIPVKSF